MIVVVEGHGDFGDAVADPTDHRVPESQEPTFDVITWNGSSEMTCVLLRREMKFCIFTARINVTSSVFALVQ